MLKSRLLWSLMFVGTLLVGARSGADDANKKPGGEKSTAAALLERLRGLEGDWLAAQDNDHVKKGELVLQYRLTGGGTAVVETIFPGTAHEMLSVYHRDGDQLVMTHYCCMGNQPRMQARQGRDAQEIVFEFVGGTNLNPEKDAHIHGGVVRFLGSNQIHSEWDFYAGGKFKGKHTFDLVRKQAAK